MSDGTAVVQSVRTRHLTDDRHIGICECGRGGLVVPLEVCRVPLVFRADPKRRMPSRQRVNDDRPCLIFELIGCDIDNQGAPAGPRVRSAVPHAKHIRKAGVAVPFEVFCQQQHDLAASAARKVIEGDGQAVARAALDRLSKQGRQPSKLGKVVLT
jgi:hypothetical protein